MNGLTKEMFVRQLIEMEGIELQIEGEHPDYKKYDGGCNVGKLGGNARVTTLLQRLQRYHQIDPEYVLVMMPNGRSIYGSMLIEAESDIRMGALRNLRTETLEKNRNICKGQEILITQAVRDAFKDIRNGFTSMYLFPDAFVIVMKDRHDGTDVFDMQRNMIPVVVGLTSVKEEIVLLREVSAKLTEDAFIVGGKTYNRAKVFFRQD